MQIVDQIPIEAVLSDDVNRACGNQNQLRNGHENEEQKSHEMLGLPWQETVLKNKGLATIQWGPGDSVQGICICWHVWRWRVRT